MDYGGGYAFVELFFMISGYFLMKNINSVKTELKAGSVSLQYMGKKIRHIYPFFLLASLSGWFTEWILNTENISYEFTDLLKSRLLELSLITPERQFWFLEILFLGCFLLYPILLVDYNKILASVYGPCLAILFYVYCLFRYGNVNTEYVYTTAEGLVIVPALIRGLAGLLCGCFAYELSSRLRTFSTTRFAFLFAKGLEVAALCSCIWLINIFSFSTWDFIIIILFFVILVCATGFEYCIKSNKCRAVIGYLGKISLPLYCFQSTAGRIMVYFDSCGFYNYFVRNLCFWGVIIGLSVGSIFVVEKVFSRIPLILIKNEEKILSDNSK